MDYYVGILDNEGSGDWGIVFPDVPGCVSQGDTFADAVRMGTEALSFHISGLIADGQKVPKPRPIEKILAAGDDWYDKEDGIRGVVAMIPLLPEHEEKPQPTNLSLEPGLVRAVDQYAAKLKKTRSAVFAEGARFLLATKPVRFDHIEAKPKRRQRA
jgi:predicted RNase H-like HicB family nuclease